MKIVSHSQKCQKLNSSIVEKFPNDHQLIAKHYMKPLKAYMDNYVSNCPNGSLELFEQYENEDHFFDFVFPITIIFNKNPPC